MGWPWLCEDKKSSIQIRLNKRNKKEHKQYALMLHTWFSHGHLSKIESLYAVCFTLFQLQYETKHYFSVIQLLGCSRWELSRLWHIFSISLQSVLICLTFSSCFYFSTSCLAAILITDCSLMLCLSPSHWVMGHFLLFVAALQLVIQSWRYRIIFCYTKQAGTGPQRDSTCPYWELHRRAWHRAHVEQLRSLSKNVQILARLNLSVILMSGAASGNVIHLKAASLFSSIHVSISRSWLTSKDFSDAFCEQAYIYLHSTQQYGGFLMTDLELCWISRLLERAVCIYSHYVVVL